MELNQENKSQIEKIVSSMDCPKDFKCYKSGFDNICEAVYHGLESYANCVDEKITICKFRILFGYGAFCKCPLRVYLAKNMKI